MDDIWYMKRALELAALGMSRVSPNPMVGCVLVQDDKIIGEGFHQRYGEAHAEVNAINSVQDPSLLAASTAYVTLEPCAHFGKTPPCADLLIEKKIGKVIIAMQDPFGKVDGKGIEKLKSAGIAVEVGLLEDESRHLNRRFLTFHKKKRPYAILKWAETADGFLARANGDSKWISNPYSRQLVHKWRTEEDAILVGKHTTLNDNPKLTSREWTGKNPTRILLDSNLEVPISYHIFNDEAPTLIFNLKKEGNKGSNHWIQVDEMDPDNILNKLFEQNIQSVIIEGGTQVLNSFIGHGCWDEARVFRSDGDFGEGIKAPIVKGSMERQSNILNDQLTIYTNYG
ncbi:MAG: bifunctional diaminohydroxyphosphoribosylaminopyrimidine deaminase/5-amino-6-(5-phosphoribosylamino)uracil reductase RibD [Ekhidna sp.]